MTLGSGDRVWLGWRWDLVLVPRGMGKDVGSGCSSWGAMGGNGGHWEALGARGWGLSVGLGSGWGSGFHAGVRVLEGAVNVLDWGPHLSSGSGPQVVALILGWELGPGGKSGFWVGVLVLGQGLGPKLGSGTWVGSGFWVGVHVPGCGLDPGLGSGSWDGIQDLGGNLGPEWGSGWGSGSPQAGLGHCPGPNPSVQLGAVQGTVQGP